MSKILSTSVQKESTQKPVNGKTKKGSSESCQNQAATIEKESCVEKKVSFSDMVSDCVQNAFAMTSQSELYDARRSYEEKVVSKFISLAESKLKDLLIALRKERNDKKEYLRLTNQPTKFNYKTLSTYKFVTSFRQRLGIGRAETADFTLAYSSTKEGVEVSRKYLLTFEQNVSVLQYRFTNSLLMLKKKEKEAKLAELKAVCESWIAIGLTRVQAVEMNKTLNNPTLISYIEYLDLMKTESESDADESKED